MFTLDRTCLILCVRFDHSFKTLTHFIYVSNIQCLFFKKRVLPFIQWNKHIGLLICTCLESTQLGQHRQLTSVRMAFFHNCFYIWGLYHKINYEGLSSLEKNTLFSMNSVIILTKQGASALFYFYDQSYDYSCLD